MGPKIRELVSPGPIEDLQTATDTVTVNAGTASGNKTINFPRAFAKVPTVLVDFEGTSFQSSQGRFNLPFVVPDQAVIPWVMPAANTEFLGLTIHRTRARIINYSLVRIVVNVQTPGPAGSTLQVDYSTDNGATWNALTNTVAVDVAGVVLSGAAFIPAGALIAADLLLRVSGTNGNGVATAEFGTISLELVAAFGGAALEITNVTASSFSVTCFPPLPLAFGFNYPIRWVAFTSG